jgi:peptide/nickel transport system substrate-binding protein
VGRTRIGAVAIACALALHSAAAETYGGTLRIYNSSNPPSASPHEDTTIAVVMPFMAVYNNLVRYDPVAPRNSFATIIPELATAWEWNASKTTLKFKLRSDVRSTTASPSPAGTCSARFTGSMARNPTTCAAIGAASGTNT